MNAFIGKKEYFPGIGKIKFEGVIEGNNELKQGKLKVHDKI